MNEERNNVVATAEGAVIGFFKVMLGLSIAGIVGFVLLFAIVNGIDEHNKETRKAERISYNQQYDWQIWAQPAIRDKSSAWSKSVVPPDPTAWVLEEIRDTDPTAYSEYFAGYCTGRKRPEPGGSWYKCVRIAQSWFIKLQDGVRIEANWRWTTLASCRVHLEEEMFRLRTITNWIITPSKDYVYTIERPDEGTTSTVMCAPQESDNV